MPRVVICVSAGKGKFVLYTQGVTPPAPGIQGEVLCPSPPGRAFSLAVGLGPVGAESRGRTGSRFASFSSPGSSPGLKVLSTPRPRNQNCWADKVKVLLALSHWIHWL